MNDGVDGGLALESHGLVAGPRETVQEPVHLLGLQLLELGGDQLDHYLIRDQPTLVDEL